MGKQFMSHVHGFKPGRSLRIFQGEKILSTPSFGREVKPFVPCPIFAACKRTQMCKRGSRSFWSKLPSISRPSSSSFHYQGLWWRHLAVQVGTTKDQGLYNNPSAAVHPGGISRRDPTTIKYDTVYRKQKWQDIHYYRVRSFRNRRIQAVTYINDICTCLLFSGVIGLYNL